MKFLLKNKKYITGIFIIIFGVFYVSNIANAGIGDWIEAGFLKAMGSIAYMIVYVCGLFLIKIISLIHSISGYNNFINEPDIIMGWRTVRDLCNMFFVLIFLVIAFATILRVESYQLKKALPKLIIMAILINFSKTICGLMIDFSQVIMLTFVNAFSGTGGEFAGAIKMKETLSLKIDSLSFSSGEELKTFETLGSYAFAIIFMIISLIVLVAILITFLMRIIMFWIYIILSPLAFLLSAFPQGAKYASQYWGEFTKYLINGPVLAFFVWLALVTANNIDTSKFKKLPDEAVTEIMGIENLIGYIISVGFLVGGLIVSQQIGGMGSAWGAGMVRNLGSNVGNLAKRGALLPAKLAGKGAWELIKFGADKRQEKGKFDWNLKRQWTGWQDQRARNASKRYQTGLMNAQKIQTETGTVFESLMAGGANPRRFWETITSKKGRSQLWMGGKKMSEMRDKIEPELNFAKFKSKYLHASDENRVGMFNDTMTSYERLQKEKQEKGDKFTKQKELDELSKRADYVRDADLSPEGLADKKKAQKEEVVKLKGEFGKYVPAYDFETKSLEARAVSEAMSEIGNMDDADQLNAILFEELAKGKKADKSRIKAVLMKMTKDANDNEFLAPLSGRTDWQGLQKVMEGLSTEGAKAFDGRNLYAGFTQQEAYELGAQIAEMNKSTKHWDATGAYVMDNGRWRRARAEEHALVTSTEFGKAGAKSNMGGNRLATGVHITDPDTGETHYELSQTGVIMLQSFDHKRMIERLDENMTESFAKFIAPFAQALADKKQITQPLADAIIAKAGKATNFGEQYKNVDDSLKHVIANQEKSEVLIKKAEDIKNKRRG